MSFTISIIGIDGSGKSTLIPLLITLIPAELGLSAVAVGDDCWGATPKETLFRPDFQPDGELLPMRFGRLCRGAAKALAAHRLIYPPLKLAHLALQERTAGRLAQVYRPDVVLTDGNLLLSAAGRAINYVDKRCLSLDEPALDPVAVIEALYGHICAGKALPPILGSIAGLASMRRLRQWDDRLRLGLFGLPDALVFLDVDPATALARLRAKEQRLDPHENFADLSQAQVMYRALVTFLNRYLGLHKMLTVRASDLTIEQTLARIVDFAGRLVPSPRPLDAQGLGGNAVKGQTKTTAVLQKAFSPRYLARVVLPGIFRGRIHELTFPFSRTGRLLMRQGYSAEVMRTIYQQDQHSYGLLDNLFLAYPLHRAVYGRLQLLNRWIGGELCRRLARLENGDCLRILTVPSGHAFDLRWPLQRLVCAGWDISRVNVLASDLDPDGRIEVELRRKAQALGIGFDFVRGDMTLAATQRCLSQRGPYDIVLFVGFSCWIIRPHLIRYLQLIRRHLLAPGGVLLTDCFSPHAFALSGKYLGYRANYYTAPEYGHLLAYAGFHPECIAWESEPAGINHVFLALTAQNGRRVPKPRQAK